MKLALSLIASLPLLAFAQYDEELGYMAPAYPVDSSKPVLHSTTLLFGLFYSDRMLREGKGIEQFESSLETQKQQFTINSMYSQGFRCGYNYTSGRLYLTMGLGLQSFHFDHSTVYDHWKLKDTVEETSHQLRDIAGKSVLFTLSTGFGIQILRPGSKFNVTPIFMASPAFAFGGQPKNMIIHDKTDYHLVSPTRDSTSNVDTTYNPKSRKGGAAMFDLMTGVVISYRISEDFSLQAQYMTGVSPTSLFDNRDKMRHYISAGFYFHLPEKTNYKPKKLKRIRPQKVGAEETEN